VVLDPITNLSHAGTLDDTSAMLMRLLDYLKAQQITTLLTAMTTELEGLEKTDVEISSLVDTWLLLRDIELGGERNRAMHVLKSRGMAHSNQIREFLLTDRGIQLADVYLGPEGVLTGSARQAQEAREEAAALLRREELESQQRALDRKRDALEARIAALRKEFEAEEEIARRVIAQQITREEVVEQDRRRMEKSRQADNGEETVKHRVRLRNSARGRR